jgi:protein SCO1/2
MNILQPHKLLLIAVAMLALAGGYWFSAQFMGKPVATRNVDLATVTIFPASRPLPELTLIDQDNELFDFSSIKGQWSLLFMGFTNCGHICPMTMAELRAIHDSLPEPVNVIFVSVDPNRDSPEIIRDYVRRFDDTFLGVTGTAEELEKLAGSIGAPILVDTSADNYIVDHSTAVFLLDPSGALAGTITPPFDPARIAADLQTIM